MGIENDVYAKEITVNNVFREKDVRGYYIGITFIYFENGTANYSAVKFYCEADSAMNILKTKSGDENIVFFPENHFVIYQKMMIGKKYTGIFMCNKLIDFVDTSAEKLNLDTKQLIEEWKKNQISGYFIV